ncbi:MAG TPA: hypothetical protein VF746_02360 [Longimicrobium sp.]|jgi:tetratricopeptide (TPR) repeat protein
MTRPSDPRRRPFVPFRAPRPLLHRIGTLAFSGSEILEEYAGIAGFVLWQSFRDVELSATASLGEELFHRLTVDRRSLIDELEERFTPVKPPLLLICELTAAEAPAAAEIAAGCDLIADWSEQQSRLATASEYAQMASLTDPKKAMYAVRAARTLRMRAEWARAWSWFDHAIFLARRSGDWNAYSLACVSLGYLYLERGNFPKARQVLKRALRAALRHHLVEQAGAAYHNLFVLEASSGHWDAAESCVVKALKAYPSGSRFRPRLARDLEYRFIQRGYFGRALPLAQEVLEHFTAPAERALVWSDIARAAAGAGNLEVFERAWTQAFFPVEEGLTEPFTIAILLNLAHGAAFRGEAARASVPARQAMELARARQEGQSVLEAEALLDSLRSVRSEPAPAPDHPSRATDAVTEVFLRTLQQDRAAA